MLHASIRGKLQIGSTEPDRFEDAITSTVLGSLVLVGAWDVLSEAFSVPTVDAADCDSWFWPRLTRAEPDAILKLGSVLLVIEAKCGSRKGGAKAQEPTIGTAEVRDQLVREWESVSRGALTDRYPVGLAQAVMKCTPQLAYLVDARRARRARLDLEQSLVRSPTASMRLATWQRIHSVLYRRPQPWARIIRQFLERQGLASFRGDWTELRPAALPGIIAWRAASRLGPESSLHAVLRPLANERARSALSRALAHLASGADDRQPRLVWRPQPAVVDLMKSLTTRTFGSGE